MKNATTEMYPENHLVVSRDRWIFDRKKLLEREKELTHLRDQVARERRELPWVRVEKNYIFDTLDGQCSLAELFVGRRQLIVQHFMFAPGWEEGCSRCSYMADHTDGMNVHLANRDVAFVAISRASLAEIQRFQERMGWQFQWVSSNSNDFNFDFNVSFTPEEKTVDEVTYNYEKHAFESEDMPGISVFYKNTDGQIFHTYSTYRRGVEVMMGTYNLLDLTPKGRDEKHEGMEWVRHRDRYETQMETIAQIDTHSCCATKA
jgi:predicted dithiol-disulfide oxidoreductase (DUF899 family)